MYLCYSYSTVSGIYGSKQTETKGVAGGQGLFINSHEFLAPCTITITYIPPDWSFVVITVNTSVHVRVFTVTLDTTVLKAVL